MKTIIQVCIAFGRKISEDCIYAFSSNAAFFTIIAFFPFAMFALTVMSFFPMFQNGIPEIWQALFPETVAAVIDGILSEMNPSGTAISITVVLALWSASVGMLSISRGFNNIYRIRETRNYFIIRAISILHTLLFAVLLLATFVVFVLGNKVTEFLRAKFPPAGDIALLVISARTLAGIGVLLLFFLFLFCTLPNRKSNILKELPGAAISALGWVGFSYLFSYYINNMANYKATYGSLTAIVLCMLWIYACMYIMFVGAEINSVLFNPVTWRALKRMRHKNLNKTKKVL